jgi:hypothetical protein
VKHLVTHSARYGTLAAALALAAGAAACTFPATGGGVPTAPSIARMRSPSTSAPAVTAPSSAGVPPAAVPPTTTPRPAAPAGLVQTGTGWDASGLQGPMPGPGTCHYARATDGYALPDPSCTPGAIDTAVTQADLASTICSSGYTSSVRPPESMTEPAKYRSMDAYGSSGSAGGYEYDHLVPLELGGSSDVRNLWPEPDQGSPSQFDSTDSYGMNAKDGVEDRLHAAVCSGQVSLAAAQQAIATDWTTAEARLGINP